MTIYPLDGSSAAARGLLRDLREGAAVALLADRDLMGDGVEVDFFGERTTVPGGPAALSLWSGAPLVAVGLFKLPHGRYRVDLVPVPKPEGVAGKAALQMLTQALVREQERLIR